MGDGSAHEEGHVAHETTSLIWLVPRFFNVWWEVSARLTLFEFLALYLAKKCGARRMSVADVTCSAGTQFGTVFPHNWYMRYALRSLVDHGFMEEHVLGMTHTTLFSLTEEGERVLACYLRRMQAL
jgi:hypothetical protein